MTQATGKMELPFIGKIVEQVTVEGKSENMVSGNEGEIQEFSVEVLNWNTH